MALAAVATRRGDRSEAIERARTAALILEHLGEVCRFRGDADRTQQCLDATTVRPAPSGLASEP